VLAPRLGFSGPKSPLYLPNGVSPNESPLLPGGFETAGFAQVVVRGQSDFPYRQVAPRLLNQMLGVLNSCDRVWGSSGHGRFAQKVWHLPGSRKRRPLGHAATRSRLCLLGRCKSFADSN